MNAPVYHPLLLANQGDRIDLSATTRAGVGGDGSQGENMEILKRGKGETLAFYEGIEFEKASSSKVQTKLYFLVINPN